ncbi:MAG: type IX secretion system membrane protein PorP/SprF [Cellulophaga sp.]
MKKIITLVFLACSFGVATAQQDAQYTQYMYNTQVVNPAYAGSRGVFSITTLYRSQWTGVDGAPTTQTLTLNTPVSNRVGLGLSLVNDEVGNGTSQNTYFDVDFSYTVPVSDKAKLSFGIKAGGHLLDINLSKLRNYNPGLLINQDSDIDKKFSPNFGAGVYYHTNSFYVGLSVPNFLETQHFKTVTGSSSYLVTREMEYYLISGLVLDFNYHLKFKPSLLLKATGGAPLQADLSANFLYRNNFSFGLAYRWDAAVSALIGFQVSDRFMLGMAYDRETSELGGTQFNDGSFEFFLRFELRSRHRKVLNARFF